MNKCATVLNKTNNRNIGIELLRIVSMMMIVILHLLGHGGILKSGVYLSSSNNTAWFLEIACYGAVNLYALITGFVCVKSKHKYSRIIELWLQVALYSILFAVLFHFIPGYSVDKSDIIGSLFPVMNYEYWYFSAYFCLFLFIPFINNMIVGMSKNQYKKLIFTGICAFCIMSLFGKYLGGNIFGVNKGYSFIWLAFLYIIGAYLKLYQSDLKKYSQKFCLLTYFICVSIVWASKLLIIKLLGITKYSDLFVNYVSPFILLGSVCFFIFFLRLKINRGKTLITKIASVSFGVYLIQDNKHIRAYFIQDKFVDCAKLPWYTMLGRILIIAVIIYIACSLIDYIRKSLFKLLHVHDLCEKSVKFIKEHTYSFTKDKEVSQ